MTRCVEGKKKAPVKEKAKTKTSIKEQTEDLPICSKGHKNKRKIFKGNTIYSDIWLTNKTEKSIPYETILMVKSMWGQLANPFTKDSINTKGL